MNKRLKTCLVATASLLTVCIALACVLSYIVFTPARLTPIANGVLDRYLVKAKTSVERVELTYFSTFPFFSLRLKDVLVLSKDNPWDTLAYIPFGAARLNLTELLNRNVIIDELDINGGLSRVVIDSVGRLNWDIFPSPVGAAKKEQTSATPSNSPLNIADIKKIRVNSGRFIYENAVARRSGTVENADIRLKGSFAHHRLITDLDLKLQNINYRDSAISAYLSDLKLSTYADISNVLFAPPDSLSKKVSVKNIHIHSGKIVYENAVSKHGAVAENADIRIKGSFDRPRLLADMNLKLQNVLYHDSLIKTGASDLQISLNVEGGLSNILASPIDSLFNSVDVKKTHINSENVVYENVVSKQSVAVDNAEIRLVGSFVRRRLVTDANISLNNVLYQDASINTGVSGLKLKLNGGVQDSTIHSDVDLSLQNVLYQDSLIKANASNLSLKLNSGVGGSNIRSGGVVFISKLGVNYDKDDFLNNAELRLSIDSAAYDAVNRRVDLRKLVLGLNGIKFSISGGASILPSAFKPDIRFALDEASLKSLYGMVPRKFVSGVDSSLKIFSGSAACSGRVRGVHSKKSKLQVQAAVDIKKLRCKFQEFDIDSMDVAADGQIPLNDLSSAKVHLRKFTYRGNLGDVSILGGLDGLGANPFIDAQIAANLNLRDLKYVIKDNKDLSTAGKVNLDLKSAFKLQDLLEFRPENLNINGVANIDTVVISNPKDSLSVFIDFARLRFGAQVDDTTLSQGKALLKGSVRLDSLDLNYKNLYVAKVGRLSAGYKCEEEKDSSVNTQSARFSVRGFNLQMPEKQIRIRTTRTSTRVVIKSNPNKPTSPLLTLTVSADTLAYRDRASRTGIRLGSAELSFNLMPVVPRERSAQATGGERGAAARRDSTRAPRPPNYKDMSSAEMIKLLVGMATEKDTATDLSQKFLRAFNYDGSLQFSDSRLRAPTFALPLQIASTAVSMTTRELFLKDARISMGNSDLLVTGALENFRRALLGRGALIANAQIKSKKIDLNELMLALVKKDAETTGAEDSDKNFFEVKLDTAVQTGKLFVIPENLDFKLLVDIDTLLMGRSQLSRLHGGLDIKQQYLHLNNFNFFNKAGRIDLKMLYRAQTPKEANLWTTLNLEQAAIRDLIDIYPEIDSLLPMTKSLDGLIDCNVQISTKLDSAMSVLLSNTVADFRAKGKNLVLLDGETFSQIAKTLMFKNKSRNMMDSISMSLVVKDNAIEIFPMVIAIDRYKFAVGGVQNLDMTFNYHVTVLESPLAFKLGVDINGGVDKFNYKITRPKYKNVEKAAISKEFVDRTVSVQREVKRLIDYEFEHIMENMMGDGGN